MGIKILIVNPTTGLSDVTDSVEVSTGSVDGGKPVLTNVSGVIDPSMLNGAVGPQGPQGPGGPQAASSTVAELPTSPPPVEGTIAYALNGCKSFETPNSSPPQGTGVPVYYSQGDWLVIGTDQVVQA